MVETASHSIMGTRNSQQDAVFVTGGVEGKPLHYAILCDGMGGMENGAQASLEGVRFLREKLSMLTGPPDPGFLKECALALNATMAGGQGGTTLTVALIAENQLHWLSVGDSRLYILRGEEMVQISTDHCYALHLEEQVALGILTKQEALLDPRRHALLSYIGAPVLPYIDTNARPFFLQGGDTVLLCSDGLVKALTDDEIVSIVRQAPSLPTAAVSLTGAAASQSPHDLDNTSVALLRYRLLEPNALAVTVRIEQEKE